MSSLHIRNPLARMVYNNVLETRHHQSIDHPQWYEVKTEELPTTLCNNFIQFDEDPETKQFLDLCYEKSDWVFTQLYHSVVRTLLCWFMSSTSVNGLLQRGSMFVFSVDQFQRLLNLTNTSRLNKLLDLGAGDGMVTKQMAGYFDEVYVTEMSPTMIWRLQKLNYTVLGVEEWHEDGHLYDVISCLNLLDRCDKPLTLLNDIRRSLVPYTGRLLLAVVLPFSPYHEYDKRKPEQLLHIEGSEFEEQASSLVKDVFTPAGFAIEHFSRLPYLCEGDLEHPFYVLNDAIFVLKPV